MSPFNRHDSVQLQLGSELGQILKTNGNVSKSQILNFTLFDSAGFTPEHMGPLTGLKSAFSSVEFG